MYDERLGGVVGLELRFPVFGGLQRIGEDETEKLAGSVLWLFAGGKTKECDSYRFMAGLLAEVAQSELEAREVDVVGCVGL